MYRAAANVAADRPPCFQALRLPSGAPLPLPPCTRRRIARRILHVIGVITDNSKSLPIILPVNADAAAAFFKVGWSNLRAIACAG